MARLNFDPRNVEPNQVFEPIPTSWYTGQIVESEMKATSKNDGHFLKLKVQVMGGDYNGRTVFDQLNLDNPNQQTVDIAYRTLSAICHAVGLGQQEVEDSQMLHGRPLLFKVNERPARTDPVTGTRYDAGNEIKGYKAMDPTAAPVLGPSKAQQRPFGAPPNGPMGNPAMQPGSRPNGPQNGQPPTGQPPSGWGAAPQASNPANNPQPQQYQPQQQPQQNWANGNPPHQAQGSAIPMGNGGGQQSQPLTNASTNVPANSIPQQTFAQQTRAVDQAQQPQPVVTGQPQGNVGNPALAQGTPPPWAQPASQPQTNGNGAQPPWQK